MPVIIGLFEIRVTPNAEILAGSSGAFVHVVANAASTDHFIDRARQMLHARGLQVVGAQDVEPWDAQAAGAEPDPALAELAADVEQNPTHVRCGTFHTWLQVHA